MCWKAAALILLMLIAVSGYHRDPYKVLGVRRSATQQEITQAFRRQSRQWHPDKNPTAGATANFQEISQAYHYLTDPSRQHQPWDFEGPEHGGGGPTIDKTFDAFHKSYHFVLDLDPFRMWQLLHSWIDQQIVRNWDVVGPFLQGGVDQSLCLCLESAWRLPQVTEPVLKLAADNGLISRYKPGEWRTWRISGALLELSFWVGRQAPCLLHHQHSSSTASSGEDVTKDASQHELSGHEALIQLQQQLQQQRKLRRQMLGNRGPSSRRASNSKAAGSGSVMFQDGLGLDATNLQPSKLPGQLLWCTLFSASIWLLRRDRQLLAVGAVAVAAGMWFAAGGGGLMATEGSIEALADALQGNSWQGLLAGSAFVMICLVVCLLVPYLMICTTILALIWCWAAVTCIGLAMTPVLSRTGLALWLALKAWNMSTGSSLQGGFMLLMMAYVFAKKPRILLWWVKMLLSPLLLVLNCAMIFSARGLSWLGVIPGPPDKQPSRQQVDLLLQQRNKQGLLQQQYHQQQQQQQGRQQQAVAGYKPANGPTAASANEQPSEQQAGPVAFADSVTGEQQQGRKIASNRVRKAKTALFSGPWWPESFDPYHLAVTSHWWVTMLGCYLPSRALEVAAVSCKISFAVVAFALAAASFGVPASWLTFPKLTKVLLLRLGPVIGGLIVVKAVFDDLAYHMDPVGYILKQQRKLTGQGQSAQRKAKRSAKDTTL